MKTFVDFIKEGEDENIQYLKESNEEDYLSELLNIDNFNIKFEFIEYPYDVFYFSGKKRCIFELCQDELGVNESIYNNLHSKLIELNIKTLNLTGSELKDKYFVLIAMSRGTIHTFFEKIFNRKIINLNKHKLTWVNVLFNPYKY